MWLRENTDRGKREVGRGPVVQIIGKLLEGTNCTVNGLEYVFLSNKKVKFGNEEITMYAGPNSHYDMGHDREIYVCIFSINKRKISVIELKNMETKLKDIKGVGDFNKRCESIYGMLKSCNESVRLLIFDINRECIKEQQSIDGVWKKETEKINISNATTKRNLETLKNTKGFAVLFDSSQIEDEGNGAKK